MVMESFYWSPTATYQKTEQITMDIKWLSHCYHDDNLTPEDIKQHMDIDFTQTTRISRETSQQFRHASKLPPLNNNTSSSHTWVFLSSRKTSIFIIDTASNENTLILTTVNVDMPNTLLRKTWVNNTLEVYSIH